MYVMEERDFSRSQSKMSFETIYSILKQSPAIISRIPHVGNYFGIILYFAWDFARPGQTFFLKYHMVLE